MSGRITGEETPRFSSSPTVMIETGVTSEPVPAVVGTRTSGRRGPLGIGDTPRVVEIFIGAKQQGGKLGNVQRGTAAETDHAPCACRTAEIDGLRQRGERRIGFHGIENGDLHAGSLQRRKRGFAESEAAQAGIGDEQHIVTEFLAGDIGQSPR